MGPIFKLDAFTWVLLPVRPDLGSLALSVEHTDVVKASLSWCKQGCGGLGRQAAERNGSPTVSCREQRCSEAV